MTKVLCVSLECKHNCGDYVCEKRSHEDENTITIMVGPYWRCDEYEEGEKNGNDPR